MASARSHFLIWNASASAPGRPLRGRASNWLCVADLVAARPPEPLARFLADRGSPPCGVRLLKHVTAVSRQSICREGLAATIDGAAVGEARERDSRGRPLTSWQGCRGRPRGRGLPHESAVGSLARRTQVRPSAHLLGHQPRDSALDDPGLMTCRLSARLTPLSPHGRQLPLNPSRHTHARRVCLTSNLSASVGERQLPCEPSGSRAIRSRFRSIGAAICASAIMFGATAQKAGTGHTESTAIRRLMCSRRAPPFAALIALASQRFDVPKNWIRAVTGVESSVRVRALTLGSGGPSADHAKDLCRIERALSSASRPYNNILASAAYLREMHDRCGSLGSSPRTTPGRLATKNI